MSTEMPLCEMFAKVCELGIALGVTDLVKREGAWVHKVDDQWIFAVNPHDETLDVKPEGTMGCHIPFGHVAVWYNGWLAGILAPNGGEFAAGSGANEDTFIAALDIALKREADDHPGDEPDSWRVGSHLE